MQRLVSVWLPAWPIDRLRRALQQAGLPIPWSRVGLIPAGRSQERGELPFALVESGVRGLTLTTVNASAWEQGVRPGQTLADARAALPALLTRTAEPTFDRAALAALAAWAGRYGPRRNIEGSDGLWIDISGVAHLFGGETRLVRDLIGRLVQAGICARAGLADTPGAAFALARFATFAGTPQQIAPPGASAAALAALPVEALRLTPDAVLLLKRLGLRRIGQLYDLPREALAQRFRNGSAAARTGARKQDRQAVLMAGAVLTRIDQALARAPEPRVPLEEPPIHSAQQLFAEPLISAEGVASAIAALAHDLERQLTARSHGGTRFTLGLYRADSTAQHITIGASRPCRSAAHLIGLLDEKLAALDAGFGIDALTLAATRVEPLAASQITLVGTMGAGTTDAGRADAAAVLLDRLSNRLGTTRVVRLAAAASHIPEQAERRIPVIGSQELALQSSGAATGKAKEGKAKEDETAWRRTPLRPPVLLSPPEPVTVLAEVPEGPPLRFTWRRLTRRIVRAQGPERIAPEWWRTIGKPAASSSPTLAPHLVTQLARPRDYYAIEDDHGGRYWLFRAGLYNSACEDEEEEEDSAEVLPHARPGLLMPTWFIPTWFIHGVFG